MKYAVLSSGSKGNSTLIQGEKTCFLIDCGITKKKLIETLNQCGVGFSDIQKVLISHNHSDHIGGLKPFKDDQIMCYKDMLRGKRDGIPEENLFDFESRNQFNIGEFRITLLRLSHDCPNTSGFLVEENKTEESLVYLTDTGYLRDSTLRLIKNKTYYVFESNHDVGMLYNSDRPMALIRRIHSDKGHLDNVAASTYLSGLIGDKTREITLAHLSEECNTPEKALETYLVVMQSQLGYVPENILVRCASIEKVVKGGGFLSHD